MTTGRASVRTGFRQWAAVGTIVFTVGAWLANHNAQALPRIVGDLPMGLLLPITIGSFAWTLFPVVMHATAEWHRATAWIFYLATMVLCAWAGTAVVATVPFLVGVLDARDIATLFRQNIVGTVPVTIVIGIAMILIGRSKARIEATELSLRTQQLERERAEKLAAEAQLASLSSRVQPHFLFNTLNSISGLIRQKPAQAESMIEHLSSLLRASLDGRELVDVAQELKLVTDYLEIQRMRLGDRLRYDLAVAPDVSGRLPPFSVQTLVENSLKHVASRRPDGIAIRIEVLRDGKELSVSVTDDGSGFDPDAMRAGHGLDILKRRLRGVFGDAGTLEFDRQPRSMTVRLRFPVS
ncbi:MAG TPA: histidine kinase [Vicinamibacterales bacterium]|nr:histidine kinase [Vicinamibacterales bacterium]